MSDEPVNPFQSPSIEANHSEPPPVPLRSTTESFDANELALVQPVPPPWNGRVLTKWHFLWAHLSRYWIYLLPTAFLLYIASPVLSAWRASVFMLVTLVALLLVWGVFMFSSNLMVPFWFEDRYLTRKMQREVRARPDTYISAPNSVGCQFVACIPPENWKRPRPQLASDVAMMKIDTYASTIYLEGDEYRYRIPAASLTNCSVLQVTKGWTEIWLLRLNFHSTTGPQELFLRIGDADAFNSPTNSGRKRNAEKYWTRIVLLQRQRSQAVSSDTSDGDA